MKITITGGHSEAEFIISMFMKEKHQLIVINDDIEMAKKISQGSGINVYYGDPARLHILQDAGVENSDILISLCDEDTDNYVVCKLGKTLLNVKKCICIVKNPKNVSTFKKLGLGSVVSSTYLLYQTIKGESEIESIVKTLSIANEEVAITEIKIKEGYKVVGKQIKELDLPMKFNICCIVREPEMIIPDGNTTILSDDKLLVVNTKNNVDAIVNYFKEKEETDEG